MASKRKPECSPEGEQPQPLRRRSSRSLPDIGVVLNSEPDSVQSSVCANVTQKPLSFQDMVTTSLKNSDVLQKVTTILAPSLCDLLKPFVQNTIDSSVSATVNNTMQKVKSELIEPVLSTLSQQAEMYRQSQNKCY